MDSFWEIKFSDILTICGWIITLIVFYIPWKTAYGKSISVKWDEELTFIDISQLSMGNLKYLHLKNKIGYGTGIQIINPSNTNISYFDMDVYNLKTKEKHMIMMKNTALPQAKNEPLLLKQIGIDGNLYEIVLKMPVDKEGVFFANSSTNFDLVISESPIAVFQDEICIEFFVTYKESWFICFLKDIKFFIAYMLIVILKIFKKDIVLPKNTWHYKRFRKIYKLPKP